MATGVGLPVFDAASRWGNLARVIVRVPESAAASSPRHRRAVR